MPSLVRVAHPGVPGGEGADSEAAGWAETHGPPKLLRQELGDLRDLVTGWGEVEPVQGKPA